MEAKQVRSRTELTREVPPESRNPSEPLPQRQEAPEAFFGVMYNACYGGFTLSKKAMAHYRALKGMAPSAPLDFDEHEPPRHDPDLVRTVAYLGREAGGEYSEIQIERLPIRYRDYYYIDEYDGSETVCVDYKQYKLDRIKHMITWTSAFEGANDHQKALLVDIIGIIDDPLEEEEN